MTNKTILNLKKLKSFHIHNGNYDPDIDRAIKALEQEPCDAISRQTVLDILWHTSFRDDYEYKVCKNKIIELPPVNPQPICEEREKGECPYYAG